MSGPPPLRRADKAMSDPITLYAIVIERLTGKETPWPAVARRWPAVDQTRSPEAAPPAPG